MIQGWEQYHVEKIAITAAVLAGATLQAVSTQTGHSVKMVAAMVQGVCQRRNPRLYYAEVVRLLTRASVVLHVSPSLAFLRAHRAAFGFDPAGTAPTTRKEEHDG
jgi:hypothetical protein